jgi:carbon-monoxide dehydrogenase medium subunit
LKHSLREADFAIAMVGTVVTLEEDGNTCRDVRIGIGSAGPVPRRAFTAEEYLKRTKTLDDKTILEAAERAIEGADPPSDVHGSKEYRLETTKVLTKRSLKLALDRIPRRGGV